MSLVNTGTRAIVPYGRYVYPALTRYVPAYRKARAAYQGARYAYKGARVIKSMITGRSKRRERARRKRQTMSRVGERVGSSNCKFDAFSILPSNINPETLYQVALLNVTKSAVQSYDRRLKDQLNFRGIKFCLSYRTQGAVGTAKIWLNVAVISPKTLTGSGSIPQADFFRDPQGNGRSIDFGDASLNNLDYRCCAINTDIYNIHSHRRHILGSPQETNGTNERVMEWYMPVKRQIRYEDSSNTPEGRNLYLVYWFATSDGGTPTNSLQHQYRVKRYFKESLGL